MKIESNVMGELFSHTEKALNIESSATAPASPFIWIAQIISPNGK